MPARDGVRLATDVYRPTSGGPFPVLLERTPYNKSAASRSERTAAVAAPRSRAEVVHYFVQHRYAVVYQDFCGRYRSEGRFTKYLSEAEDGYDCGGFSNAYRSSIRHGGAFDLKQATWAYNNALADAKDPAAKAALEAEDIRAWFARMPWRKGQSPVSAAPDYEDYLFEQCSHGIFDDFWERPGIYAEGYYERYADVPIVHLSGR